MKKILLGLFCLVCLVGCITPDIDKPLPELYLDREEPYVLDTSSLKMPDAPNFILLVEENNKFRIANDNETPTHVALLQEDLVKIDTMITIKKAYEKISVEQAALINVERNKIDALKELLEIERNSRQLERALRMDTEEALAEERKDHKIDNIISRVAVVVAIAGGVAIAAL
jgi:hypothetical protein